MPGCSGSSRESNRQVTEALEQQTATSEVLRVIASSPTDLTTVLQNVVESASRLCEADLVGIWRVDGQEIERVVNSRTDIGRRFGQRVPLDRGLPGGRVILDGTSIHLLDFQAVIDEEFPTARMVLRLAPEQGYVPRTYLAVPLMRDGKAIGAMSVERAEVRAFTDAEIALMETFADQAVIAIENARLFEELQREQPPGQRGAGAADRPRRGAARHRIVADRPRSRCSTHLVTSAARRLRRRRSASAARLEGDARSTPSRPPVPNVWVVGFPMAGTLGGRALVELRYHPRSWTSQDEQLAEFPASPARSPGLGAPLSTRRCCVEGRPSGCSA